MFQYQNRLVRLKADLLKSHLDGLIVTSTPNITYLTGFANFSIVEREAFLLVSREGDYILTDGRYSEAIKKQISHFELVGTSPKNSLLDALKKLIKKHQIENVGIEEADLTVSEYKKISPLFKKIKNFEVHKIRSSKEDWEIELIEKAAKLGDKTFSYILKKLRMGITEKQLAFELESFIRNSAEISFPPIVAFGPNSSIPHHQTGEKILEEKNGQFILLDFGVKFDNYCSDMSRTLFFGKASERQKRVYQVVLDAQQKTVEFINRGSDPIKAKEVDKVARDYIRSKGYPSIPHSLGHGIGLEVHEPPALSPKSKHQLKDGMVFSIEPGIYLEGFGGVRIEDLFVIEKNKLKQLTHSPKNLIEL